VRVYFMRHGQTNYNVLGLCNENPAIVVSLTDSGKAQAEAAAERLKEAAIRRIVVSPLPRTRETAEIVNRHHRAPIVVHPDIHDFRTGLDGRPVSELYERLGTNRLHGRATEGGETLYEHKQRVLRFIEWLRAQEPMTTLVVAHEETLRVVIAHFHGLSDEAMLALTIGNCEVVAVDVERLR
jgi:alpha-ribazole phosphatase